MAKWLAAHIIVIVLAGGVFLSLHGTAHAMLEASHRQCIARCAFGLVHKHKAMTFPLLSPQQTWGDRREEGPDRCFKLRLMTGLGGGLFNQHLAVLAFATMGVACGASELHITASTRRYEAMDNFTWLEAPFDTLWDKAELAGFLQGEDTVFLRLAQWRSNSEAMTCSETCMHWPRAS